MIKKVILFLFLSNVLISKGQEIFTEKFSGCNTNMFFMENDTTVARLNDSILIKVITGGFDETIKDKIQGTLKLQIIVDNDGSSCLLSASNKTNYSTKKLNIKQTIDSALHWNKIEKRVAAILQMDFNSYNKSVQVKRMGFNSYTGWQFISDKMPIKKNEIRILKNQNTKNHPQIKKDRRTKSIWKLYNFTNSMIPSNFTRSLAVDSKGVLWCCTDKGLISIKDEKWKIYDEQNSSLPVNEYGISTPLILIVDSLDRVWVGFSKKMFRYDGNSWQELDKIYPSLNEDSIYSALNLVQEISIDKNGVLWFGTFMGLVKFENDKFTRYTAQNSQLPSNSIKEVFVDNKNVQWVATDSGLVSVDKNKWVVYNTRNSKLPCNNISTITGDSLGNLWIGTNRENKHGGLIKIDDAGNWTIYDMKNSLLPDLTIWKVVVDKNIVWLCMYNGGLVRIEENKWELYNNKNSTIQNDSPISDLVINNNGDMWISTFKGLVYMKKKPTKHTKQ